MKAMQSFLARGTKRSHNLSEQKHDDSNFWQKSGESKKQQELTKASNFGQVSNFSGSLNDNPHLVGGVFEVKEKLGQGSFGEVRLAIDVRTKKQVAIKFEHKSDLKKHLRTENEVYSVVKGKGFPNVYWFGKHGDYTALVMDRCGASLKTLYSRCNRIFPVQTVALIAIQLLERLEHLHNHGWLHQDIKPENIVIGSSSQGKQNVLYLIDYGTSGTYIDAKTKKHRVRAPSTKIVGTARYSSLNNHYGYKQSRRDDLESLGYTIIYWLLGRLPWQGIEEQDFRIKWKKVRRIKRAITPDELCRGLPVQFRIFMKYVFKLSYAQRPNYGYLRGLFRQLLPNSDEIGVSTATPTSNNITGNAINNTSESLAAHKFAWEKFNIKTE